MKQAIFLDFYGTLVHEDGPIASEVVQAVCTGGAQPDPRAVYRYWWQCFSALIERSNRAGFVTQYALADAAFVETVSHFASSADPHALCRRMIAHWSHPLLFSDSLHFVYALPVPYYFVTNGDTAFLDVAIEALGLHPAGVISSERAQAYKPDPRIFSAALDAAGLPARAVVHIGDSLANDVTAARAAGIDALWLNRTRADVPEGITAVASLTEAQERLAHM